VRSRCLILCIFILSPVFAAEPEKSNVLDFDADIIQGERRRPDLFVQLGGTKTSMEAVLYSRQNFNDYHSVDQILRPGFYEVAKPTAARPGQRSATTNVMPSTTNKAAPAGNGK
jgi:hypothetical protein